MKTREQCIEDFAELLFQMLMDEIRNEKPKKPLEDVKNEVKNLKIAHFQ